MVDVIKLISNFPHNYIVRRAYETCYETQSEDEDGGGGKKKKKGWKSKQ